MWGPLEFPGFQVNRCRADHVCPNKLKEKNSILPKISIVLSLFFISLSLIPLISLNDILHWFRSQILSELRVNYVRMIHQLIVHNLIIILSKEKNESVEKQYLFYPD